MGPCVLRAGSEGADNNLEPVSWPREHQEAALGHLTSELDTFLESDPGDMEMTFDL